MILRSLKVVPQAIMKQLVTMELTFEKWMVQVRAALKYQTGMQPFLDS